MADRLDAQSNAKSPFLRLAEYLPDVVYRWRVAPSPTLQYINPAVTRLLGYTPAELIATPAAWLQITHPDDLPLLSNLLGDPASHYAQLLTRWRHKNGEFISVKQDIAVRRSRSGRALSLEAMAREVAPASIAGDATETAREVSLAILASIASKNAERYEAEHFERLLAQGLQKITETMVRSSSATELFSEVLDHLSALIQCQWAAVLLVRGDELVLARSTNMPVGPLAELLGTLDAPISSPPGPAEVSFPYSRFPLFFQPLTSAEPVLFGDIQYEFDPAALPDVGMVLRSWIGVPIIVSDVIVGYLAVAHASPNVYSARDVNAVQSYANQAALMFQYTEILSELEVSRVNLRQARAQLVRTAHLQMAGEIATGIAHKVNNPLTTVIAETYLLARSSPPDSDFQESIRAIREAAYEAGTVVQRLMDTAHVRPFLLAPLQVNDTITAVAAMIRGQIEPHIARLTLDLAADLPLIDGSAEHLRDVWLRLLLNARDAIDKPGEGRIIVTTRDDVGGGVVRVTISDNGRGIASEHLDDIFKPLYTTKQHGTGLSLALCNETISKHHGTITVESNLHQGTTFEITFKARPPVWQRSA